MNIELRGNSAEDVAEAKQSLGKLVKEWDITLTEVASPPATAEASADDANKVFDPISLTILILAIPPAVLAVMDIADRIKKRKRAQGLIDHAKLLSEKRVFAIVVTQTSTVELRSLTPDRLLELAAAQEDTPAAPAG